MDYHSNNNRLSVTIFQMFRFAMVGVIATAIHYGIYMLVLNLFSETIAYSIGYIVSFVINFFATCLFTFRKKASPRRGVGFAMAHVISYCLHILFLNVFLRLGMKDVYAPIPVFCIVIPINFILIRYVFNRKES